MVKAKPVVIKYGNRLYLLFYVSMVNKLSTYSQKSNHLILH